MNDNLQVPNKYRPIPKAHLFLHKLRKINIIDRQIRQKWANLQKKKAERQQRGFQQILEVQKLRQAQDEMSHQRIDCYPNKVTRIRSDIIREEASLRKKLYDQVYFKKNRRDNSPTPSSQGFKSLSKIHGLSSFKIENTKEESCALFLRRRTKTMEKQLNVIRNRYEDNLKQLSIRKQRQESILWESQKSILKRFEGQKFYYQLASSWEPASEYSSG